MQVDQAGRAAEPAARGAEISASRPLVLLGGTNPVARCLIARLAAAGRTATVVARRPLALPEGFALQRVDVEAGTWAAPAGSAVVSILPLAVLARCLPVLGGAVQIVAISSTSLTSKAEAQDAGDRAIAARLAAGEAALQAWCAERAASWTILRPTLVYDGIGDRNIARMARLVRRFGLLPIAAPASGLRQPVHADDVAQAILAALERPAAAGRILTLTGGETLTYRAMAERVFRAQGRRPRVLGLPVPWLAAAFTLATRLKLLRKDGVSASAFARMNEDLVFDRAEAEAVLGFAPRPFTPPHAPPGPPVTPPD